MLISTYPVVNPSYWRIAYSSPPTIAMTLTSTGNHLPRGRIIPPHQNSNANTSGFVEVDGLFDTLSVPLLATVGINSKSVPPNTKIRTLASSASYTLLYSEIYIVYTQRRKF
jgi:hypothetical protein